MTIQTVTLKMPSLLYNRIKRRAERAHRSVETELLEAVATAMPALEELPDDLTEAVTALALLDDATLRRVAESCFSTEQAAELESLHFKRQDAGLTESEARRSAELTRQYERAMVIRAQAMALLMQRGFDVSDLVAAESK